MMSKDKKNPELRFNPFIKEWVLYSPSRQMRPDRESSGCPFCEGSEEVPSLKNSLRIPNKYPALSQDTNPIQYTMDMFHKKRGAYGKCEIVVYTANHEKKFIELSTEEILDIFNTWIVATKELSADYKIKYILPFENYGEEVGASIIHPHGQIYALPFIPKLIQNELEIYKKNFEERKQCMVCDYLDYEIRTDHRVIYNDQNIIAVVPYFAKYAYDVYIYPKRCYGLLRQSTKKEKEAFAEFIPRVIRAFNKIFGKTVSYSLSLHQTPLNNKKVLSYHLYFKLHTPQRNSKSLKILGAVESSLGVFINGTLPEDATKRIKNALY